ncbi:unnamed protein product, partial [Ectocarpus sp. 8 AP-2014]
QKRARRVWEGRRRGERAPTVRKPPWPSTTLKLASTAFLVCGPSLGFVVGPAAGFTDTSAFSSLTRRLGDISTSGSKSSRRRSLLSVKSGRLDPENNVTPANGLVTSSTETLNGGGGGHAREVGLQSENLASTSGFTTLETALAGSPFFGKINGGRGGDEDGRREGDLIGHFDAMERVVLTANANLQRVISSYYNSPVTVDVVFCTEVGPGVYEREVEISVLGHVFCVAKSLVVVHDPACAEAVKTGRVGLGQLFHSLNILPSFELLNAGRRVGRSARCPGNNDTIGGEKEGGCTREDGGFWRLYDLRSGHVSCRIYEEFPPDLFGLEQGKRVD